MNDRKKRRLCPKKLSVKLYPDFSDRLKVAMEIRGYSTSKLSRKIHTAPSTITMYRCGKRLPSWDILCLISMELDVSTDFLLGLRDFFYV